MPGCTTHGWGTTSARAFLTASGAVLLVMLAGCSSGETSPDNPAPANAAAADANASAATMTSGPAQDERPAFHFESGDLVLGDFSYEDIAGNIFNPCEEISAEEFAAIGFETDGEAHRRRVGDINGCVLKPLGDQIGGLFLLTGGSANLDAVVKQGAEPETDVSTVLPGVYAYRSVPSSAELCFAAVDTHRGQVSFAALQKDTSDLLSGLCSESVEHLENLYRSNN